MLDMSTDRPDFGSQKAQAHLHQAVIEMREDNIITASSERCIDNDGSDDLGVRMRKTLRALLPAPRQRRKPKDGAHLADAGRIRPDAIDLHRDERRLFS